MSGPRKTLAASRQRQEVQVQKVGWLKRKKVERKNVVSAVQGLETKEGNKTLGQVEQKGNTVVRLLVGGRKGKESRGEG